MNPSESSTTAYTPLGDGHITELLNGSTSGSAEDSDTSGSQGTPLIAEFEFTESYFCIILPCYQCLFS